MRGLLTIAAVVMLSAAAWGQSLTFASGKTAVCDTPTDRISFHGWVDDGSGWHLYSDVNGTQYKDGILGAWTNSYWVNNTNSITFGNFAGSIADPFRAYSYSNAANEVAALYQEDARRLNFLGAHDTAQILDFSGNGNGLESDNKQVEILDGGWVVDTTSPTLRKTSPTGIDCTNMTLSVWFKQDAKAASTRGLFARSATGVQSHFALGISASQKLVFNIPWVAVVLTGNAAITDVDSWHLAVYRRSNDVHTIWLDSVVDQVMTNSAVPKMAGSLDVGYAGGWQGYDGYIGQCRMYASALTDEECDALYTPSNRHHKIDLLDASPVGFWPMTPPPSAGMLVAPSWPDAQSGGTNVLTEIPMRPSPLLPINAAIPDVWDSSGEGNKWSLTPDRATGPTYHNAITDTNEVTRYGVYAFDNSDDAILENGITTPEDFTVSVWLYQSSNPSGYDAFLTCAGSVFRIGPSLNLGMGVPFVEGADYSTGAITLNRWYHLVWVVDSNGGPIKYYIDGEYDSQDASFASSLAKSIAAIIGTYSTYRYHGYLDELRVYSGLLNTNQVAGLYHGEEPTNNPIIRLDFDDKPYEWPTYDGQHTITAYPEGTAGPVIGE